MELSREDLIFSAYLSEEAEKYDDMLAAMTQLVHQHPVLTTAERNLLSVAFKNIIGHVRASHRIISSLEAKEMPQNNEKNIVRIQKYREKIENEIRHHIQTFLDIIENILIPNAPDPEAKVFYSKMQGDYWRYIAEIETNEAKKYATERSQNGYDTAFKFVESLSLLHPLRLGLCLNYSVFCYEILNDNVEQARALDRAQKVYRNILENLDNATEEEMRDLEPILRLIQNLPLFPNNMNREHEESRIDIDSALQHEGYLLTALLIHLHSQFPLKWKTDAIFDFAFLKSENGTQPPWMSNNTEETQVTILVCQMEACAHQASIRCYKCNKCICPEHVREATLAITCCWEPDQAQMCVKCATNNYALIIGLSILSLVFTIIALLIFGGEGSE